MDIEHERPEFYEALGRTIQVLRTDQSLDRKDLAERAGISYSYLAAIENGKKPPSSKVLFALAGALGLHSHELLASVETRWRRRQPLPAPRHAPSPARVAAATHAAAAPQAWFHAPYPGDEGRPLEADWQPAPPDPAAARPVTQGTGPVPYTSAGFLMELERLNPQLSDTDRDLVLGLARRLAADE